MPTGRAAISGPSRKRKSTHLPEVPTEAGLSPLPSEGGTILRENCTPSEGGDAVERAVADLKVNEFESFARCLGIVRTVPWFN